MFGRAGRAGDNNKEDAMSRGCRADIFIRILQGADLNMRSSLEFFGND